VCTQLHASLTSLTEGTEDYPRLIRVLANERYYELVSQDDILQAQLEIQREVEPQIKELIQLAEDGLRDLQKRERNLHELVSC
jgi:DASH complex subunit SPC19